MPWKGRALPEMQRATSTPESKRMASVGPAADGLGRWNSSERLLFKKGCAVIQQC